MKKTLLILTAVFLSVAGFSQSEKYVKAMENLVPAVDTTHSIQGLTELAGAFERIANAEKTQWLPYYYAAFCNISMANMYFATNQPDKIDPLMDKAEPFLTKAEELEKENSEIYCLKKMFNTGKMMADPMNRYMTYGSAASEALEKAKSLNPENPRVYLLEGQDKFYTPEQFGGSKEEAQKLFEEAQKKFDAFKPASNLHPVWGIGMLKYMMSQK